MSTVKNRRWVLCERPEGRITEKTFELHEEEIPELHEGEALIQAVWLGIDATQRTWLNEDSGYTQPVAVGDVMPGSGVGRVISSKTCDFPEGSWVYGMLGWQEYAVATSEGLFGINPVPPGVDPKMMLTVFGVSGLTAYFGVSEILRPAAGQTVLVTGAAGSVGSLAGQIAKAKGARIIGTAGTDQKVSWVTRGAGFDACINYRNEDVPSRLRQLAPEGLHAVFDNVGGPTLEAALDNLALHATVALCGSISSGYGAAGYGKGPRNYMQLAFRRARMEGFIFLDYVQKFPEAFGELSSLVSKGALRWAEDVMQGLEVAPAALDGIFEGNNMGKRLVQVSGV